MVASLAEVGGKERIFKPSLSGDELRIISPEFPCGPGPFLPEPSQGPRPSSCAQKEATGTGNEEVAITEGL